MRGNNRSFRGRNGPRGRGRGNPRSPANRATELLVKDVDLVDALSNDSGSDTESEEESDESSDEEPTVSKPYEALLASLATERQQTAKRRKLEHNMTVDEVDDSALEPDATEDVEEEDGVPSEDEEEGDGQDPTDPFDSHFANPSTVTLGLSENAKAKKWTNEKKPFVGLGKCMVSIPEGAEILPKRRKESLGIKKKLAESFASSYGESTELQRDILRELADYEDVIVSTRTPHNAEQLRQTYCLHTLNHIFRTRDRVLKNNARLSKSSSSNEDLEFRDQGFTRPKALFILPTRQSCVLAVDALTTLVAPDQVENKKRFDDAFRIPPEAERISENKPEDFRELFQGNHDDYFRLGLKFTRKTMKFFSMFYNSDIIIASPLGLKLAIGEESSKKHDSDFLSSIEVVVMDQTDALLQQNWEHVDFVFKHLNKIPKEAHGCDFGRVRHYYLDSQARYLRQTLVVSAFLTPEINALAAMHMVNVAGKVKQTPEYKGVIGEFGMDLRQVFERFDAPTPLKEPDARFAHFTSSTIPSLLRSASSGGGVLVFIPSYFEFVRVRNHLNSLDISFGGISEESPPSDVARTRSHFSSGKHRCMIYSGRAHHFRRLEIRGVREVVFYGLPDNQVYFREVVGFLGLAAGEGKRKVKVAFSKWDILKLERVVGTSRVREMCAGRGDRFEFV